MEIVIGQIWRDELGNRFKIVWTEEDFIYVNHPSTPKKRLGKPGGGIVARSEFKHWHLIEDAPAMLER